MNCSNYFADEPSCSGADDDLIRRQCLKACMDNHRSKEFKDEKAAAEKLIQEAERSKLLVHKPSCMRQNVPSDGGTCQSFTKRKKVVGSM